mgnify:CR=1 FL=1
MNITKLRKYELIIRNICRTFVRSYEKHLWMFQN